MRPILAALGMLAALAALGGCSTFGEIVDINAELTALDEMAERANAAPAHRSDVEAMLGPADYLMPSRNVAVYTNYRIGGRYAWRACERRPLYALAYRDDVVEAAWYGFIIGDLGGAGAADLFARRLDWFRGGAEFFEFNPGTSPRETILGALAVGTATRDEVLAAAGPPYYVAPAYDIAVYVAADVPGGLEDDPPEEDEQPAPCIGDACGDVVVSRTPAPCPTLNVRGLRPEWYAAQYDDGGAVLRFERLEMSGDFRLDAWTETGAEAEETPLSAE